MCKILVQDTIISLITEITSLIYFYMPGDNDYARRIIIIIITLMRYRLENNDFVYYVYLQIALQPHTTFLVNTIRVIFK